MTQDELIKLTHGREKRTLEYKTAWSDVPSNLFETVCAFLNREGGIIVLGAQDDGSLIGVNPASVNQMCKNIANMSNNEQKLCPPFLLQPESVVVKDAEGNEHVMIAIQIPSSSQVHQTGKKIFDRSVDGDYEIRTDAERSALYLRKGTQYSENRIYPYLRREHLSEDTITKAKNLIRDNRSDHPWLGLDDTEFFRRSNLYREDISTGEQGFTLSALLLFGKTEIIQSALPFYRIDAIVRFHNTDRYDDRITIEGNIIDAYEELMAFISKALPDTFYQESDGRRVSVRNKIFREVVANLLIHREYLNPTPTVVTISKDGVIAVNANRPLRTGPVTLDNYERHPKNPHIANFFVQMGYAEHLGTGIKNIYRYTELYTGKEPILDDDNVFKVLIPLPLELESTIKNANLYMEVQKKVQKEVQKKGILITNRQLDVLVRMAINPSITRHQLTNELSVSIKNITDSISALKNLFLLERRGGKKSGKWVVLLPNINTEL